MRFIIAVDLEGISCAVGRPNDGLGKDFHYDWVRSQAVREANATARGFFDAGATQVIIWDNHGTGINLPYDQIDSRCDIMLGRGMRHRWGGVIEGFNGAAMIGYHAMDNTSDAVLAHTFSSVGYQWMSMNGVEVGEMAIDGAAAGRYGVPIVLVSSDAAGVAEAKNFFPWAETVITKQALSWNAAISRSPVRTCEALYEAAVRSVSRLGEMKTLNLKEPIAYKIRHKRLEAAQDAVNNGWTRADDAYTVEKVLPSLLDMF